LRRLEPETLLAKAMGSRQGRFAGAPEQRA
jgi:hypothetical protein